jgi:uncharacterized protein YndB with AHSA1/START domain
MKHQAEFLKDENGKQLHVTREFNAPVEKVWQAWTTAELLDKWWAPRPWTNHTKSMDFREGGRWLYSMTGPQGEKHWSLLDYKTIVPQQSFIGVDAFCDEEGNKNSGFPGSEWNNLFKATATGSKVEITITYPDEAALQQMVEMGFKEGFSMGLTNLDELLEA